MTSRLSTALWLILVRFGGGEVWLNLKLLTFQIKGTAALVNFVCDSGCRGLHPAASFVASYRCASSVPSRRFPSGRCMRMRRTSPSVVKRARRLAASAGSCVNLKHAARAS